MLIQGWWIWGTLWFPERGFGAGTQSISLILSFSPSDSYSCTAEIQASYKLSSWGGKSGRESHMLFDLMTLDLELSSFRQPMCFIYLCQMGHFGG
jgi:hypothetical protein